MLESPGLLSDIQPRLRRFFLTTLLPWYVEEASSSREAQHSGFERDCSYQAALAMEMEPARALIPKGVFMVLNVQRVDFCHPAWSTW